MEKFNDRVMPYVVAFLGVSGCCFVVFWLVVVFVMFEEYKTEKLVIQNGQSYVGNVSISEVAVVIRSDNKTTVLSANRGEIKILNKD